ncbi:Znfinger in Ran binding protein and others domain containing protein [Acanthamoeba castellanii str. Neff]|uniref:Znfinger in Ran binding protein and others domain containing protein n=1 Tax=Acanthamoeba castellanii (strain ATCC 30010 / Neff) TaxID=1257118 RepID=L8GUW1_ACACF|nr:Znfinger in Ran binding protein and others domain containing protein [Acanthamoeba castellanii str. Neff]ELR16413.1 Znfinger in Ran binding protein and others domain containing protein [Acanthamoeba castellanii str. Neff]
MSLPLCRVQALTLESILSRMMQLFDARKQKLKDAKAHFEKVMRDQELLKRFDDDYFGKREAYYHKASTVEPSGMKAHLEAYGITQEVKAMHGICGKKSLRLSKDTGQASDVQKHILAVKRGHKFPLPYLVVKQSQGEGDREGEEISNNRIASFYFKSIAMKYLRETWGANTRRKHFRHIRSWFSKNDDDVGNKAKAKGDEEEEGDEELDGDHEEEDMWVCGACTYLNVHGRQKCEICETPAQQHELGKDRLAEKKSRNTASASFMGQCSAKFLGGNFFGMADHRLYCLICHRKHACASETPLVCCAERCVHYYEAMQMGQSFATTVVCTAPSIPALYLPGPYTSCKAQDKIDREEAVVATFAMSDLEGQEMDRQAAELLLNMYRHQFLPNSDVKKFFFNGFKSWWGLGGTIKAGWQPPHHDAAAAAAAQVTSVTNVMRPELVARGNDVGHKSDTGWWGGGIYLSPDPMVSSSYAWNSKLIVCAALLGRPYHCKQRMDGQACQKGYDSHISPWWSLSGNLGKEWVLFDEGQVMPCYVISFHKQ